MAARPTALLVYDGLPVSSGGAHGLGSGERSAIWSKVEGFLAAFTTSQAPDDVRLLLSEGPHIEHGFSARVSEAATTVFGPPRRRLLIAGTPTEHELAWSVGSEKVGEVLSLMEIFKPIPEHLQRGVLVLGVEASFQLCDPTTRDPFPGQDPVLYRHQEADAGFPLGMSRLYLRLSQHSTCALFLSLPFTDVTPEVRAYVAGVNKALPFRLSQKHWSRWQLNTDGSRYYKRRIVLEA